MTSTSLGFLQCLIVSSRDVHDESIADSLLCLHLDLLAKCLVACIHKYKCFPVFGIRSIFGIEDDPRSFKLYVVPRCHICST